MNYELKHIRGIPYYLQNGTDLYTFELDASGKSSTECIRIGTYHSATESIHYDPSWRERVQPRLDAYRESLFSQQRDTLRETIVKPQKSSHSKRAPRKSAPRAKSTKSK
jgi:hypothetical protein